MNDNNEIEQKDMSKANIWTAVILAVIAVILAVTPFLYLKDATS